MERIRCLQPIAFVTVLIFSIAYLMPDEDTLQVMETFFLILAFLMGIMVYILYSTNTILKFDLSGKNLAIYFFAVGTINLINLCLYYFKAINIDEIVRRFIIIYLIFECLVRLDNFLGMKYDVPKYQNLFMIYVSLGILILMEQSLYRRIGIRYYYPALAIGGILRYILKVKLAQNKCANKVELEKTSCSFHVSSYINKLETGQYILAFIGPYLCKEYFGAIYIYLYALKEYLIVSALYNHVIKKPWEKLTESVRLSTKQIEKDEEIHMMMINLSHEFKTPLNVILSASELLTLDLKNEKKMMKNIYDIKYHSYKSMKLIRNLIDLNRLKANYISLKKETYNINQLIANVVDAFNSNYGKEMAILIADDEEIKANVDFELLQRVLLGTFAFVSSEIQNKEKIEINLKYQDETTICMIIKNKFLYQNYNILKIDPSKKIEEYMGYAFSAEVLNQHGMKITFLKDGRSIMITYPCEKNEDSQVIDGASNIRALNEQLRCYYGEKVYFKA